MKKNAALFMSIILLVTMLAVPVSANTTDITVDMVEDLGEETAWSYEPMSNLVAMGVVSGYPTANSSTVKILPQQDITRAEFAAMLVQALNLRPDNTVSAPFTDVAGWYKEFVDILYANSITTGYNDRTFRPGNKITRAEIAAMLAAALNDAGTETSKTFSDVAAGYWGYKPIMRAAHLGIISGYADGRFQPKKNATRAEVMTMIYRFLRNDRTKAPEDKILLDVTDSFVTRQSAALSTRPVDFSPLAPNVTGELEYYLDPMEEMFNNIKDAVSITYEKLAPGQVEFKSDRLAKVSYAAKLSMKLVDPATKQETVVTDDFTDYYLLMKIGDKWLIYTNFDAGLELQIP